MFYKKTKEKKIKIVDKESGYDKKMILKSFILPNGMTENFFIDEARDSVQVFAITKDEQVVCVKQFRPNTETEVLELPGGGIESNEKVPSLVAKRELLEETGFEGDEPVFLSKTPYNPYSTGNRYSYLITNCKKTSEQDLDPNEIILIELVPMENFRDLMRKGAIRGFECAYLGLDYLQRLKF